MDHIQTNTSDEALVASIRLNMCDFFRYLGKFLPESSFENHKFVRWHTPLPHPWFNGVLATAVNDHDEGDNAFIEETIRYYRSRGVDVFTWWLEPPVTPSNWKQALSEHGFGFLDDTPGMAVDLQALDESPKTVDGLEVRVAADEESLRTWVKVFVQGYGLPPEWESPMHDLWLKLGPDLPMRNYLGYWHGEPVSNSTLFLGGGAAGIYCVATLREARGKGIGAALTLQPLLEARDMGYRIGVLQSSEMGFNVYKRMGFRHLCQIENFYMSLK
ncbi:MAG: hypothetical protein FIB03_11385 [Anaerolineae bacterium]|nr:hypothetical protein [Anaerolineae bacterium]